MNPEKEALDREWEKVRKAELIEIAERRKKAELDTSADGGQSTSENLVGLALSGGGIRSASFNLGVLQALVEMGLFRYIDFLSTVSGGGYIGAFLSSLAYRQHKRKALASPPPTGAAPAYEPPPIARNRDGSQPDDTKSLARRSNFLNDKLDAVSRYLIGWFFNIITLASGLVFAATLVALLWRCLDMPFVVDFMILYSRGMIVEWNRPFLPAAFFFAGWILAWIHSSYWKGKGSVASARNSGKWLVLAAVSFLIGLAIWLGTPNMNLTFLDPEAAAHNQSFWNAHQQILTPLLIGLAASLIPFLNPRELLKSGIDTKSRVKGWIFQFAGYGMIIGIPFVTVWFIGRHNVSLVANGWDRPLVPSDIVHWEKFWHQIRSDHHDTAYPAWPMYEKLKRVGADQPKLMRYIQEDPELHRLENRNVADLSDLTIGQYYIDIHSKALIIGLLNKTIESPDLDLVHEVIRSEDLEVEAQDAVNNNHQLRNDLLDLQRNVEPPPLKFTRGKLDLDQTNLYALIDAVRVVREKATQRLAHNRQLLERKEAGAKESLLQQIARDQEYLDALKSVQLSIDRFTDFYPYLQDVRKRIKALTKDNHASDSYAVEEAKALRELIDQYRFFTKEPDPLGDPPINRFQEVSEQWKTKEYNRHTANHLILRLFYPTHLRPIQLASRPLVILPDQERRLWILLISGGIFAFLGLIVNFNWTSIHGFYRRRIQHTFLVSHQMANDEDQEHREILLKSMANTDQGYPYHILSGCVELVTGDHDVPPHMTAFQFTKLFCGGRDLDFCETPTFRAGRMSLSSAAAISGAAVSPTRIRYLLLQVMLTVTNLRLGQWLPNPAKSKSHFSLPHYVPLLRLFLSKVKARGVTTDLSHVFVTDGGHYENLGIDMLLERRCRLIIASDAGADPTFEYADLANLFAIAARKGIRFTQFDGTDSTFDREITLESVQDEFREGNRLVLWKVHYPEGKPGLCVYMKSSMPKPQPFESGQFKLWNEEFPHDSTANQFFHEQQFEVYRSLGHYLASNMIMRLRFDDVRQARRPIDVDELMRKGVFN